MSRIVWAGDSTVKYNKIDTFPQMGLSQGLLLYLNDDVILRSFAENGRSTKSFIDQGRLDLIDSYLEEGDILLIQFGHNDEKSSDLLRYADADTDYKYNLVKFIEVARKHHAQPVLVTPLARRFFDQEGNFKSGSHGKYPEAVIDVAKKENVPVIDMTGYSEEYLARIGDIASRPMFVYPKDNTHLQLTGAVVFAGFIARELVRLVPQSKSLFVENVYEEDDMVLKAFAQEKED